MPVKIWVINLVLAAAVVFLGTRAYNAWSKTEKRLPETSGAKEAAVAPKKALAKIEVPPASHYDPVVNDDLFAISRSPEEEGGKQEAQESKTPPKPDEKRMQVLQQRTDGISIYGIVIANGEKRALIKSASKSLPRRPGNRHQEAPPLVEEVRWVRVGDTVDQFAIKEIRTTGMVLAAEGVVFDVTLYDKDKPKERLPDKRAGGPIVIDTQKGTEPERLPEKSEVLKEGGPEKKLPTEPEKKPQDSPLVRVQEPEKR